MSNVTPMDGARIETSDSNGTLAPSDEAAIAGTSLNPAARRLVLWFGGHPPSRLVAACELNGLRVVSVARDELDLAGPQARALVLEVPLSDPQFLLQGADVSAQGLDHGMAVALVHYHRDSRIPLMEQEDRVLQYFQAAKALQAALGVGHVRALYGDWTGVANWARDHEPGPGANRRLLLGGDVPVDGEAELLLRRAFCDLSFISLELLTPGRSGARVWMVRPGQSDFARRPMPFVVKIHSREKMDRERSNWTIVRDGVPSRLYAPLDSERCVHGHALGLVVYAVVDRAVPFRVAVRMAPQVLIRSVFEYTLSGFQSYARSEKRSTAAEFGAGSLKALPWSDELRRAAALARLRAAVPDIDDLRAQFEALPSVPFTVATVHGDFHAENLFEDAHNEHIKVLVWGPGASNDGGYAKRVQIRDVISRNFPRAEVFFSEDAEIKAVTSKLKGQLLQEAVQANVADLILVLNIGRGTDLELDHFIPTYDWFRKKVYLLLPEKYVGSAGLASEIFKYLSPYQIEGFSQEEFDLCELATVKVVSIVESVAVERRLRK